MASGGENGERNGPNQGIPKGPKINIDSKGNLQIGARPVLIKTSGTSLPNVTTENVPGELEKRSFMDHGEIKINQDGGNALIGDDSKVFLRGKTRDNEDEDFKKINTQGGGKLTDLPNRTSQSSQSEDEEHLNDLTGNQPQTLATVTSNIQLKEPSDRLVSNTGTVESIVNQSKPLYTDTAGLTQTAKGEAFHSQGPENVERFGARMKEPRSPGSSLASHRRQRKSGDSNIQSKSVSSADSAPAQSHFHQNIPHNLNVPEQMSRQVKSGRSLQEVESNQSSEHTIGLKSDQSKIRSSNVKIIHQISNQSKSSTTNDDDNEIQSRFVAESITAKTYSEGKELHFCVQEKDQWVQIGDCCVIVELNIDDKLVDIIKQQGDFTAEINTGEVMVNLRWGDLQKNVKAYRSSLKVKVSQHIKNLEIEILQQLFLQRCEKLIKIVKNIFEKCYCDARIVDVTKGCFQFNFIHLTQQSVDCLHSEQTMQEIQTFLTDLLITERMRSLAGKESPILRVTSLKDQSTLVDTPEEMKKYGLLAPGRIVTSRERAESQAELRPSEMRYKIQDLGNEVQHIKRTARSQNDLIQRTIDILQTDNNVIKNQLNDLTELLRSLIPKINNLEEQVKQISTELETGDGTSRSSQQDETQQDVETTHEIVTSGPGLSMHDDSMINDRSFQMPSPRFQSLERTEDMPLGNDTDLCLPEGEEVVAMETKLQENSPHSPELAISKRSEDELPGYSRPVLFDVLFGKSKKMKDAATNDPGDMTTEPTGGATAAILDEENSDKAKGFLYQFEKFLNINDTKETIKLMMQEEDNQSPRASGIDTVLCLDLSESMKGNGLDQLKQVVNTYLDGVEENATEQGLEENIAMVTFGESAIVRQNLTNDFNALREIIEELCTQGGYSSLLEALILSVFLILLKGKPVTVDGFNIPPHIILITDGNLTSPSDRSGDIIHVMENRREMIMSVVLQIKQCGYNYPITCVPVGDCANKLLLQKLVMKTNGRLLQYQEAEKLSKYYLIQKMVGKALKFLSEVSTDHITVKEVIENLTHGEQKFDFSDMVHMEKIIQIYTKPKPNYIFFDDFYVEEYRELPPLGSRVNRKNKASHLEGTIVSHLSECKVEMIWDSGEPKTYDITNDSSDLVVTDKPRIMTSQEINPPIGTLVKRGSDWRYGDQDGGIEKVGVVINVEPLGLLKVCWPNGTKNFYRFGYEGCRDVLILDIASHKLRYPVEGLDKENDDGIAVTDKPNFVVSWQWKDEAGEWWRYTKEQMKIIEEAYSSNQPTCVLGTTEHQKRLLLDSFEVRDVATGIINKIQRKETKKNV